VLFSFNHKEKRTACKFTPLSDDQYQNLMSLMNWTPPQERGTPRTSFRKIWNSILFLLANGCRWEDISKNSHYGHRATAYRWIKKLKQYGVLDRVLSALLLKGCKEEKIDLSKLLVEGAFFPCPRRREGS